jgi:hypothetical protein
MQILLVNDNNTAQQFLKVAIQLYKNDPNWVQPLNKDIDEVFDKNKNKAWRFGEAVRWILKDEKGNLIGRIAAFTNKKYKNKGDDVPVGGIGFFESINDQTTANLLLDTAKNWLQKNGVQAMDGPINFGERDKWWGMVTDGFHPPLYCMNYNPAYYISLFTNYGFKVFYNQVCFGFDPVKPLLPKIVQRHQVIATNPDFEFATIKKNQLQKYAEDFTIIYNKAWAGHGGLKELSKEQVLLMFNKMKPVMDERIIYFAYHKSEPIGMFINLPDLNHYFKQMHGKFGLLQKLKFVLLQKLSPAKKFTGLVFGIVPEWQGKGIDAFLIGECGKIIQVPSKPYIAYEMQWIGDFNPKMINVAENFGETFRSRNLSTFRYFFDTNKEFKRHPILI